eukprot:TRINITY_DN661_c0_g1_i1.p2 TRINITY_DN661_c0_g1~~TRINITY_DN661_c0_g1_i1.p2  ORF type:complete len:217 (+),score=60.02 TRINITY_DN661_c0_g1_i1:450-1100(+)
MSPSSSSPSPSPPPPPPPSDVSSSRSSASNADARERERELEHEPLMQYLMHKRVEPHDACVWFSRGMHHVQLPNAALHTAVQSAQHDRYIALLHNAHKRGLARHSARHWLRRVSAAMRTAWSAQQAQQQLRTHAPHLHLCIISRRAGKAHGLDTMSLTQALLLCDQRRLAAYVECCNERDVQWYRARGFELFKHIKEARAECTALYALWREPHARA